MKIIRTISFIDVIGPIWQPGCVCSMRYTPSNHDLENMRDETGKVTREAVANWLSNHTGDFQYIEDFYADLELPEGNIIFEWSSEEAEIAYLETISEFY